MRSVMFLCLVLLLAAVLGSSVGADAATKASFYVSIKGNDSWSGTLAAPNRAGTDGPFASLDRARLAVRELKALAKVVGPIVVQVRGGTYFLKQALEFTADDSGTAASPIQYEAYPGESPILSGGKRVTGWKANSAGGYNVVLPGVANGSWNFIQLWANGQRRFRPRLPKKGYYFIAGSLPPSPKSEGKGFDRFRFNPGEVRTDWQNLHDVEALNFQEWTMTRLPIDTVDSVANVVTMIGNTQGLQSYSGLRSGYRYLIENVKEALHDPGEWYLDRPTGRLTYIPVPGEKLNDSTVIVPRLEQLIKFEGSKEAGVEYVNFRGLTFAHTNWVTPPMGSGFGQAEVNVNAAISAVGARHCTFNHCVVEHIGNYAFELGSGCKDDHIEYCVLRDLGAGGVKIGDQHKWDDEALVAGDNVVTNCLIYQGGRLHPAGIGVLILQSSNNRVEHNTIADFYYTTVSVGWSWGYDDTQAHNNHIADNRMIRYGQGVLSDMGGIYTLGRSEGTILEGNVMSDGRSFSYGGWGIYFDEGTTGIIARRNIVYNTKTGSLHQHYGKDNQVLNNILAFASQDGQLIRTRAEDHLSFTLEHNIVIYKDVNLLGSNWTGNNFKLDNNLYWNESGKPVYFNGKTLEQWQQQGQDAHSLIADPLFVDADKYDFKLKSGSPAEKIGFVPFDTSGAGPQPDPGLRRGEVNVHELAQATVARIRREGDAPDRVFPAPPPPPPPAPISDGFENNTVGTQANDATTNEENQVATIRVTDETAHTGKHSLKFTDAPGQKYNYNPHIYYLPNYAEGMTDCSFALRVEPGAIVDHEWRDGANPYHVGPSLHIDAQGNLSANGRQIAQLPESHWVEFAIRCGVGSKATGKYDLMVTIPGKSEPVVMKGVPCNPDFKLLSWFGYSSAADASTVFYLDDLNLKLN